MRRLPIAAAGLAAGALLAVTALPSGATSSVSVGDNYFVRPSGVPTVTAKAGSRVTFRWVGRIPHDVKVAKGPVRFQSPQKTTGTFRTPRLKKGTYTVFCTLHGASDMSVRLRVR